MNGKRGVLLSSPTIISANESLGADFDELVTDRSEASGTGYWSDAGYGDLQRVTLGRGAVLPRVLSTTRG